MGLISGFIGGMAQGGLDVVNRQQDIAARQAQAQFENDLLMKRQATLEQLREQFDQVKYARIRQQNIEDAQTIQGASDNTRIQRAKGIINQDTGLNYTDDEVKKVIADPTWTQNYGAIRQTADGQPTTWDDAGNVVNPTTNVIPSTDRGRAQELSDKADAAMGIGRTDLEKGFRDQQNVESTNTRLDNQSARDDARMAAMAAETRRKEQADRGREESSAARTNAILAKIGAKGEKDNSPAEVRAVQWYLENQDDPKAMAAWNKVHESKSKNIITIAADFLARDAATGMPSLSVDDAYKKASDLYDLVASKNSAAPGAPAPTPRGITKQEYDKLPKGATFIAPDGSRRIKP